MHDRYTEWLIGGNCLAIWMPYKMACDLGVPHYEEAVNTWCTTTHLSLLEIAERVVLDAAEFDHMFAKYGRDPMQ